MFAHAVGQIHAFIIELLIRYDVSVISQPKMLNFLRFHPAPADFLVENGPMAYWFLYGFRKGGRTSDILTWRN